MTTIRKLALASALALTVVSSTAVAHHSFGHYAMGEVKDIEGVVSKFEWSNPHCWLFIDAKTPKGETVSYGFELQSVGEMIRRGWKKTIVKPGEKLQIKYRPMRDGTPGGLLVSAEKDGKRLGADFSGGPPPPSPPPTAP